MEKIIISDYLKKLAESSDPQILNEFRERGLYDGIGVVFNWEDEDGDLVECEGVLHIAGEDKENRPVVWLKTDKGGLLPFYEADYIMVERLCSVLVCRGESYDEFVVGAFVNPTLEEVKKAFDDSGLGDFADSLCEKDIAEHRDGGSFELENCGNFFVWERVSLFTKGF